MMIFSKSVENEWLRFFESYSYLTDVTTAVVTSVKYEYDTQ